MTVVCALLTCGLKFSTGMAVQESFRKNIHGVLFMEFIDSPESFVEFVGLVFQL